MSQMIFCPYLIICLVQSQRNKEFGKVIENLDATEDGEAREESHGASDQTNSAN